MICPRTKHASNDPRGEDTNSAEQKMAFKLRMFKTMEIQKNWLPEFKDRSIIMGREFERSFSFNYYQNMLAPRDALGFQRTCTPTW